MAFNARCHLKQFRLHLTYGRIQRALKFFFLRAVRCDSGFYFLFLLYLFPCGFYCFFQSVYAFVKLIVLIKEYVYLYFFQFIAQFKIFSRRGALFFQRTHAVLKFFYDIAEPVHVDLGVFKLPRGFFLAHTELHNARRLFKSAAPVRGLCGQYLLHASLTNYGIAFAANARVPEKLRYVLSSAGGTVNKVFAFAASVYAARNAYFVKIGCQFMVVIIKRERYFAVRKRFFRLCTVEYNVLHLFAAQRLCALLSQHPAHGIRNVAFAAAVGTDNGRYTVVKYNFCFTGK